MPAVIVDEGLDWLKGKVINEESGEKLYIVAVGDGTTTPTSSDTSLDNELYRADTDDSNCTIESTSNTGEVEFKITISGGTEVPADSEIAEFGVFTSGTEEMIYRETRASTVTLENGDRKTFEGTITFTDG